VFIEHGAQVDVDSQVVRPSRELVTTALAHAPRSYVPSGRAEGTDLILDGANSYCATETVALIDVSILANEGGGI
jgi:trimethylamine:corrinoid methyltransferase-like protein